MFRTPVSLLERLRRPGDEASWQRFVQLYTPLLFHWAQRLGLQPADAADLVQDVLTTLVQKLPGFRYEPNKRFRGWLWTVALNTWRMDQRRAGPRPGGDAAALDACLTADHAVALEEAEYRRHLVGRALQLMRADFQPTTWQACWEHVISGRPAAEVAADLGITPGAVYVAKSRVLRRLRQELGELLD